MRRVEVVFTAYTPSNQRVAVEVREIVDGCIMRISHVADIDYSTLEVEVDDGDIESATVEVEDIMTGERKRYDVYNVHYELRVAFIDH